MKKVRLLLVGASALALWGCGGGNGPTGDNPNALAGGRAALTSLASNTTTTSSQTLQSALTLFQQALKQVPNSSEAHFGAAVCLMGSITQQVDGGASGVTPTAASRAATTVKHAVTREAGSSPGNPGTGFVLPSPPNSGAVPPTPPNGTVTPQPIEPVHTLGLFWFLDRGLSNPSTLLNMLSPVSDLRLGLAPYYGYTNDAQDVARRQKMLTDLATVAQHLQTVEADSTFSITLPAPDQNGQPVTIGLPEVYLFDAYVQSLRVSTALSLTYDRDPGLSGIVSGGTSGGGSGSSGSVPSPPTPPIFVNGNSRAATDLSPYQALDKNGDGKLTPDEYLPASPFLTLRDASYFQTAQAAMGLVVDRETKGIAGVLARPSTGSFLIPNSTDVAASLTNIRDNVLPLIQQATTGPVTLSVPRYVAYPLVLVTTGATSTVAPVISNVLYTSGTVATTTSGPAQNTFQAIQTENVTIDIAAWFTHPPADLKVFAPTYTLNSVGYPNTSLTTYPDSTFGGLFPNGLPSDLAL